jgi:hypothetical protein
MARRRCSLYLEQALMDRLRLYTFGLARTGTVVSMSGLIESALLEYLRRRCDGLGTPLEGSSPAPRTTFAGPGRPTAAARERQFEPQLRRRAGRSPVVPTR